MPLTLQFILAALQCQGSRYPWRLCQCEPCKLKQPPVRCESALCFYRLKALVHITFLSRYNLFIQQNVLLQRVADPSGILHFTIHPPCSLSYCAVGLSAPQTSPIKGTGQQLFSKERKSESLCKTHGGDLQSQSRLQCRSLFKVYFA